MKRDCGGAAGILGAFYAAVKQGFSQNLHAIFCLAENAVGDRATRCIITNDFHKNLLAYLLSTHVRPLLYNWQPSARPDLPVTGITRVHLNPKNIPIQTLKSKLLKNYENYMQGVCSKNHFLFAEIVACD